MMRVQIKPTYQIQRINILQNQLAEFREMNSEIFMKRPNEKAWSGAEVLKHMIVAQDAYESKMDDAFVKLNAAIEENDAISTRAIPSYLIKRFPPKEGKIRFKMKTTKSFKPMLELDKLSIQQVEALFEEMKTSLDQLLIWVEKTRKTEVTSIRFNSAIGPLVRFNVSEACEFILCHNERHFQQITNTIQALNKVKTTS